MARRELPEWMRPGYDSWAESTSPAPPRIGGTRTLETTLAHSSPSLDEAELKHRIAEMDKRIRDYSLLRAEPPVLIEHGHELPGATRPITAAAPVPSRPETIAPTSKELRTQTIKAIVYDLKADDNWNALTQNTRNMFDQPRSATDVDRLIALLHEIGWDDNVTARALRASRKQERIEKAVHNWSMSYHLSVGELMKRAGASKVPTPIVEPEPQTLEELVGFLDLEASGIAGSW